MQGLLFDFPKFKITKKIRLIELFGGIGSQAMALRDIGADFEHYRLVEFDKYAVASYNAIHGTSFETADIRNVHGADLGIVERDKFTYIMTYSFPCTDLSKAGKCKGMSKADWENGSSTRSGLLWEVERIIKELPADELPQVLLMENVPQVHAEQNIADFEAWLAFLRSRGYFNFYQDLNAKDYGIPQNRDRCFCVSILSSSFIDYIFPKKQGLRIKVKDLIEKKVNSKFYIPKEDSNKMLQTLSEGKGKKKELAIKNGVFIPFEDAVSYTLFSRDFWKTGFKKVSPCLTARDYKGPKLFFEKKYVEIAQATKKGAIKCKVGGCYDASYPNSTTRRGRVQEGGDVVPTLMTGSNENIRYVESPYRIRKLTPREYWRLMGYTDADFDKASQVNSNTQLYKQAGNAIVKQVLMAIFSQML